VKNSKLQNTTSGLMARESKSVSKKLDNFTTLDGKSQRHKFKFPIWVFVVSILIALFLTPFVVADTIFRSVGIGNYTEAVQSFIFPKTSDIKSENGRVNILILGIGGKGHDGSDLTDTMILASVSLTGKSIRTVSIPRDIWIPEIRAKINSAYYWGEVQPERGGSLNFAKQIVTEVTGQPVDYAVVLDFSGFQDIINTIGGIDVYVDRTFTDTEYPIAGKENDTCGGDPTYRCRYMTVHFTEGMTHMDGTTALEFVRSRHGDNGENSDFARDARQQKVIAAMSKKILLVDTLLNISKDYKILVAVKNSITSDISMKAVGILVRAALSSRKNIKSSVLPEELLSTPPVNATYDYQAVLVPKAGNGKWGDIIKWVSGAIQ
jgi:LCP family protein required for cell wall assembly